MDNPFRTADGELILWKTLVAGMALGLIVSVASIFLFSVILAAQGGPSGPDLEKLQAAWVERPELVGGLTFTGLVTTPSFECGPDKYCMGLQNYADGGQYIAVYTEEHGRFEIDQEIIGYGRLEDFKINFLDISPYDLDLTG